MAGPTARPLPQENRDASPLTYGLTFAAAIVSTFLLVACGKPPGGPPPAPGTPEVGIVTVQPQRVAISTELPGRTVPFLIADVRPQVGGIVKSRKFREGSYVKAGEALYQIDPATYKASYDSNVAALAKAEASLRTTRLKAERYKELVAIKAVSQQDYDDAAASLQQGEADVAAPGPTRRRAASISPMRASMLRSRDASASQRSRPARWSRPASRPRWRPSSSSIRSTWT